MPPSIDPQAEPKLLALMPRKSSSLRLFAAIYPPPDIAEQMLAALIRLELPTHRCVSPEQVHLTAHFIGDTRLSELEKTIESVQRSVSGLSAFSLEPAALVRLPQHGPARLIAAELTNHSTLLEIHNRLVQRLARQPKQHARRSFLPHMTLCRFAQPVRLSRMEAPLSIPAFAVSELRLMKSVLAPDGAHHGRVDSFSLS